MAKTLIHFRTRLMQPRKRINHITVIFQGRSIGLSVSMPSSSDLEMCDLSNTSLHAMFLNATYANVDIDTSFAVFEANHRATCEQEYF